MFPSCIRVKGARRRSDHSVRFLIRRSKFRLALRTPISKNKLVSPIPVEVIKRDCLVIVSTPMFLFPTIYTKETLYFTA